MTGQTPTGANGRLSASARAHRRRFMRQSGLLVAELDAIAGAHLFQWAEALAAHEFGAARLAMKALERRLSEAGLDDRIRARGRDDDDLDLDRLTNDERATLAALVRKAGSNA